MTQRNDKSIRDTEYDRLCFDCQDELDLDIPQLHGQVVSHGPFPTRTCDRCGKNIDI